VTKTLLVTNDFPPRPGGIQQFVHNLAVRQPPGSVVVYCSRWRGFEEFDAAQPFPVIREDTTVLLPTPTVARRAARIAREHGCDTVWFGAAAPLALLADGLRKRAGIEWAVAQTHGHEVGWAALPGGRAALKRIARGVDVVTYLSGYQRARLAPLIEPRAALRHLAPGVDVDAFRPDVDGTAVRTRYGLGERPVVVCVSRLVPRKGQDTLIRAFPEVRRQVPDAALLIASGGPYRGRLKAMARDSGVGEHIVFTGSARYEELPEYYAAGDVYAMPCRTRGAFLKMDGLDVEGLGIVYLEASASGKPVVAGDSGGAPDAVVDGQTGYVVGGRDVDTLTKRLVELLTDRDGAARMGAAGRAWTEAEWRWDQQAARMTRLLERRVP
jgi:phosphatidylinositol alpha-1,6-mannosyltransferase